MELLALTLTTLTEVFMPEYFLKRNVIEYMTENEESVEEIAVH